MFRRDDNRSMTEPHLRINKESNGIITINGIGLMFIDNKTLIRYRRSLCDTMCQIDFLLTKRLDEERDSHQGL
jgi:hypothetical protein|nr:MAG TPA: hypothetical protein [Caudoviricetes sp.]